MLLEIVERWEKTERYKNKGKKTLIAICCCDIDICHKEFERPANYACREKFHTCSKECDKIARKRGGIRYQQISSTIQEKHGVSWSSKIESTKERQKQTNFERYGFHASSLNQEVEMKRRLTCEIRYGGHSATSSKIVREKARQTSIERFGANGGPLNDPEIRAQINATMLERYGVLWASRSSTIRAKQLETNFERYGVAYPFHTETAKQKTKSLETQRQRHQTRKLNGTYRVSHMETRLIEMMSNCYPVERNVLLNGWSIDAHVIDVDVYIQFDGLHWHCLENSLDQFLCQGGHESIVKTAIRDSKQNVWFQKNNKKLLRISERDYLIFSKLLSIIDIETLKSFSYRRVNV